MRHLFAVRREFEAAVRLAPHVLFLADYDGTLSAIVGNPDDAVLSDAVRRKLAALSKNPRYSVGVISGREISELKFKVSLEGLYYAGNHGMEVEGPGLAFTAPGSEALRPIFDDLAAKLAEALENISGVIIQSKGMSVSVHYRLVRPEDEAAVAQAVRRVAAPRVESGEVFVYAMKKVWEIRPPVAWDKGKAAALIAEKIKEKLKISRLLTIYLGDDTTDEDAFKVLRRPEGWSVFVKGEKTMSSAEFYLDSVIEVEELLDRLLTLQ